MQKKNLWYDLRLNPSLSGHWHSGSSIRQWFIILCFSTISNQKSRKYIPLQNPSNNVEEISIYISRVNVCFCVFVKYHYSSNNFFGETRCKRRYLFHLPSVHGIKCLGKKINNIVALRFFVHILWMIQWIATICKSVDQYLWKLSWFFWRIFLISCLIQLRSKAS